MTSRRKRIAFCVAGKPVPQPRPRINRFKGVYYAGKTYKAWRKLVVERVVEVRESRGVGTLGGPVKVGMRFGGMRRGSDLDNLAKVILDAMVEGELLEDDHWGVVTDLSVQAAPMIHGVTICVSY